MKTKLSLRRHARMRAEERFGFKVNKWAWKELVTAIQQASKRQDVVKTIGKQTLSRSRFDVQIEGKWIPVVYDNKRHVIVTVLPERALGRLY